MAGSPEASSLPIFIVDAFTDEPFRGNPAAVCLVEFQQVVPADVRQKMAAEMNLSETAFISPMAEGDTFQTGRRFGLQWFTPTSEVKLCGHATLASSAVLFKLCIPTTCLTVGLRPGNPSPVLEFETRSGVLKARRLTGGKIEIDLPAYDSAPPPPEAKNYEAVVKEAVGDLPVREVVLSESRPRNLLVRLEDDVTRHQLEELSPRAEGLLAGASDLMGVIVTLRGSGEGPYDFLSRYFAPWFGVPEDPVCGSAHSVLAPFWSKVLNKEDFYARQCSRRGGDLNLRLKRAEWRVAMSGDSVVVVRGHIAFLNTPGTAPSRRR